MERLTKRTSAGTSNIDYPKSIYFEDGTKDAIAASAYRQKAIERLAAYEDTGLEPDTVSKIRDIVLDISGDIDHLREMVQAEQDGKLVVLPCKRGDKVWRICGPKGRKFVAERTVLSVTLYELGKIEVFTTTSTTSDWLGKTVFLTREDAEAALEAQKGGNA